MATGTIGAALRNELVIATTTNAVTNDITQVIGNYFAVVWHEASTANTFLETFQVVADGTISAIQATLTIDTGGSGSSPIPKIVKVVDGVVAVILESPTADDVLVQTFAVDKAGGLGTAAIASLNLDPSGTVGNAVTILKAHYAPNSAGAQLYVASWVSTGNDLQMATFTINSAGTISAVLDTVEVNNAFLSSQPSALAWTGISNFYAIAYTASNDDGFVETWTIDAAGAIAASRTDQLEFDTTFARQIVINTTDDGTLFLFYSASGGGDVKTVTVDSSGIMTNGTKLDVMTTAETDMKRIDGVGKHVFVGVSNDVVSSWIIDASDVPTEVDTLTGLTTLDTQTRVALIPGQETYVLFSGFRNSTTEFAVATLAVTTVDVAEVRVYIEESSSIFLDGKQYKTKELTKSALAPTFAGKQVIGNIGMDSHLEVSYLRFDDWSEGIGLEEFFSDGGLTPKRAWWSTCDLSNEQHLVLGPLVNTRANLPGDSGTPAAHPIKLLTFQNELYALFTNTVSAAQNNRVYKLNDGTNSWGSPLNAVGSAVGATNHGVTGIIGGTEHIIHAARSDYAFSTDGSSWTDDTQNVDLFTIWDNRLWGVDSEGNAFYSYDPGTEVSIAPVPIPPSSGSGVFGTFIGDLFISLWVDGNEHLFASTGIGLFKYDIENDRWLLTNVKWPQNRFAGHGSVTWNGDMYIPAGMGMFRVITGPTVNVSAVGLDRDHGIPTDTKGAIAAVESGFNSLYAMATTTIDNIPHVPATAKGTVFAWNGKGWQVLFQTGSTAEDLKSIHLSSAYDTYRLWIAGRTGADLTVRYIDLPVDASNPNQVTSRDYSTSSILESPWYKVGEDVVGIALAWTVEVVNTSDDETVKVEYAIDFNTVYRTLGTIINLDGTTEYGLPTTEEAEGVAFVAIRFKVTLVRGSTTTLTPHVRAVTLKFKKKLPERWNHFLVLDISQEVAGFSPRDQWDNLRTSINKNRLLEFTFKDDNTLASVRRHWVTVESRTGDEETGLEYAGEARLTLVEPQHLGSL